MKAPLCPLCKTEHYARDGCQWGANKPQKRPLQALGAPAGKAETRSKPAYSPDSGGLQVVNSTDLVVNKPVPVVNRVVNAVVNRSRDRHLKTDKRRAYMRQYMKTYRAAHS